MNPRHHSCWQITVYEAARLWPTGPITVRSFGVSTIMRQHAHDDVPGSPKVALMVCLPSGGAGGGVHPSVRGEFAPSCETSGYV
jgi:hypothetical protein